VRWLPLLLLVGCVEASPPFAVGDDDDATDEGEPRVPLETRGILGLWYWEFPDPSTGAFAAGAMFSASFEDVFAEGTQGVGGVDFAAPEAVDACARTVWTADEAEVDGGLPADSVRLSAGPLTVTSPTWAETLAYDPVEGRYLLELNPDLTMHTQTEYAVQADGAAFPGFDESSVLHVPLALTLTVPASDEAFDLPAGNFEIEWVGGSEERVWIELHTEQPRPEGNVLIACDAWNDGAFAIPAELLTAFPSGAAVRLLVHQPVSASFEVSGRLVDVGATATAESLGVAP